MSSIKYPLPPKQLADKGWWKSIGFLGPGIIIASVSIGTGETIFASRGGAIFGYAILWSFIVGLFLKAVQIYSSSRYMMLSGEHPMQSWLHLPGPRGWLPIILLIMTGVCLPFLLAALSISVGSIIAWMLGGGAMSDFNVRIWATGLVLLAAVVSWGQSYKRLETTQMVVVGLLLVCIVVAAIACQPDAGALIKGTFVPTIPSYQEWIHTQYPEIAATAPWIELVTYVGIIGGGLPAYIGYFGFLERQAVGTFLPTNRSIVIPLQPDIPRLKPIQPTSPTPVPGCVRYQDRRRRFVPSCFYFFRRLHGAGGSHSSRGTTGPRQV